jgi:hypothetical protein
MASLLKQPTKHTCVSCNKQYTRKTDCNKHELSCKIIKQTKRESTIMMETTNLSHEELCILVQDLTYKMSKMEEMFLSMQKMVVKQNKKINIIEWLNENNIPLYTFKCFQENISKQVNQTHIECLIQNNLLFTIHMIFENNELIASSSPIYCLEQKQNIFYVCESISPCVWKQMTKEMITQMFDYIHSKIFREIVVWKNKNKHAIENHDNMSILYNTTMGKLMNIDFTQDSVLCKIKTSIFNYLKKDLKNIIEYEFE